MQKVEIRVERAEAFFERGRKLARMADRHQPIRPSSVVSFEDIESLLREGDPVPAAFVS